MQGDDLALAADLIRLKGVADELLKSARKTPTTMHAQDAADRAVVAGQLDRLSKVIANRAIAGKSLRARLAAEARAYAAERVKLERGVGFSPSTSQ